MKFLLVHLAGAVALGLALAGALLLAGCGSEPERRETDGAVSDTPALGGCPTLGDCVPACGQPDADCAITDAASFGEACAWFEHHPSHEHQMYSFSESYHCWGDGGRLVGGLDSHYCRPGFFGIGPQLTIGTLDAQYKGSMAHACADQSGIPARILAAAQGDREFMMDDCPRWHQWSVWAQNGEAWTNRHREQVSGIPGQDDVPVDCHNLVKGPG